MSKREIRVCENCGTPLIWTFRWAFNEYYCLNCGALGDMFMGRNIKNTPELKLKLRVVERIWDLLYKSGYLLPIGSYTMNNCKKCKEDKNHSSHETKREKRNGRLAQSMLVKTQGIFKSQ